MSSPDGVYDLHIGFFILVHYPVSEADHPDQFFLGRDCNDFLSGQYLKYLGLCGRCLPLRIAYDVGAYVDACLDRLDQVKEDYALEVGVHDECLYAGVLFHPDLFQITLDPLELSADKGLIYQQLPSGTVRPRP